MKKLLFLLIPGFALAQSTNQNFVKSTTYRGEGATRPLHQVTYFDGLGRPIQKLDNAQSNSGKNIITHIEYDAFGRQVKDYLPYKSDATTLDYVTDPLAQLNPYYASPNPSTNGNPNAEATNNPFSEKQLEASPLNRVLKQAAPGNAWAMNSGHEIKFDYQTNTASEVKLFQVTTTWNSSKQLYDISISNPGNYQANQLYKNVTKDENWTSGNANTTQEFKDKEGRVVLKRTFNLKSKGIEEKLDTYYIYDQYGNLTYVIPPLAEGAYDENTLNGLCYQYKYDYRNRLAAKKIPGKQWEFIVYDKLDKPVATGPALSPNGNGTSGILVTEYDVFGRVTQTGWKAMSITESTRGSWQTNITNGSNPFILGTTDILTKNFYDNYSFNPNLSVGSPYATSVKGLQTGSWVKVLDPTNPNASELSYTLYDYKYRPILTQTTNHLGGYTKVETQLDWSGKTLSTTTRHKRLNGDTELIVKDMFEYTAQDRLSLHKQQINNNPEELIAKNTYDELGQLTSKIVGGTDISASIGLQKIDYTYNIRGWLKGINDVNNLNDPDNNVFSYDLFAFKIGYNEHTDIGDNDYAPTPLYNGNISETYWKNGNDEILRKYNYDYDSLNRLTDASYIKPQSSSSFNSYLESLTYDKNGNILSLYRNGGIDSDGSSPENNIDNLAYDYHPVNKNQLMRVTDNSLSPQGFKDGDNTTDDYEYDSNGNMVKDLNKKIASNITYNHLNLPVKIVFDNNENTKIEYIYNATGKKVGKKVKQIVESANSFVGGLPQNNTTITSITDYLSGGFQYSNNVLQFFPHAEGYVRGSSSFEYIYNFTDHLGNVRYSYNITDGNFYFGEENNYYPFGAKHEGYSNGDEDNNKYKYNGKEFQDELGLNMYDYGARNYDPAIGRYFTIDNFSEAFYNINPYQYTANNPVKFIDVNGDYIYIHGEDGTPYRYDKGKTYSEDKNGKWIEYTAKEGSYVAQIVGALNDITQGDENSFGSKYLDMFANDDVNVNLTQNISKSSKSKDRNITQGTTIYTSFNQKERVMTTSGMQELSFSLILAHELAHGLADNLFKDSVTGKPWISANSTNGLQHDIPQEEIFASMYENMIRAEKGLPLRTHYIPDTEGSVLEESRLIKKSKVQNAFNNQYEPTEQAMKIWNNIINSRK